MRVFTLEIGEAVSVGDVRVTVLDIEGEEVLLEIDEGDSVRVERLKLAVCG
jgi:sRNA-binding carbon storage regulator CsrA